MKNIPQIIENVQPRLGQLAEKYRVDKLYVFGSSVNEKFGSQSDIDLLVSFKKIPLLEFADNYFDFQEELEQLFSRKVDLVIEQSIQNPYLAKSISETRCPCMDEKVIKYLEDIRKSIASIREYLGASRISRSFKAINC